MAPDPTLWSLILALWPLPFNHGNCAVLGWSGSNEKVPTENGMQSGSFNHVNCAAALGWSGSKENGTKLNGMQSGCFNNGNAAAFGWPREK